ncbi:DUF1827 family protein [Lacticaseibacillus baoqingensis]|uniref:DUF1827 family protein n=1 Tax=Lacticaseibacillus baoqingensis TaxID=2486013 RepID=A0ABW4E2F7_9LACO|nr:DUF1827 family protein [Lacticaseibacillus baoqingensis]
MRLIDITNSYPHLVAEQLAHTDTQYLKVYSLGSTTVVYSRAKTHDELLFTNDTRNIQDAELEFALAKLCGAALASVTVVRGPKLAEITLHTKQPATES